MSDELHSNLQTEQWRKLLCDGHLGRKYVTHIMRLLPGPPRCKGCNNPFGGIGGALCRSIGMVPSKKNPRLCTLCCEKMPLGGAEVEVVILFADVRGSTELAERLGPEKFAATLNRFYNTATDILIRRDATVDKLIGDEVMAFFVPGFAGPNFRNVAIDCAITLLRTLGYGGKEEPWLPVGIGIDSGIAFVGNVGNDHYLDFTALGDPVNTAARIQAAAGPGQLLVSARTLSRTHIPYSGLIPQSLTVKGKKETVEVYALPITQTRG
ncbi:MAG: adenylate cyclase [Sneathiella sp.]|jgi:adenylate cyclase|uniref:adenylate/guanylate cyclase domain-containing protein n=1 Tax=Sneathiella sp. TaxID=1964365 RepID=UPI000C5E00F9|nr:adenylate/guanylate cyclase domain-containing protein [Sneathiella sp.]MAL79813.1 adenylate cyclase [Sneathiella sp.]|tara:strand:- start:119 stop:919 length:801 start_codon:yes stop_codon:yes gene_type:complete